jgi:ribonuclease P/MRP protein subunit RPP1
VRYPFHFRHAAFKTARARGIRFEICYAQAVQDGSAAGRTGGASSTSEKRRNFISNVLAIVRATGGRGLVVSSEARSVLGVRAPADVANLLAVWGVPGEWPKEAVTVAPRSVVVNEGIRRTGYRGVIDVVEGEEVEKGDSRKEKNMDEKEKQGQNQSEPGNRNGKGGGKKNKMMHADGENGNAQDMPPMSKRQAKKMRLAARGGHNDTSSPRSLQDGSPTGQGAALDTPSTAKKTSKT